MKQLCAGVFVLGIIMVLLMPFGHTAEQTHGQEDPEHRIFQEFQSFLRNNQEYDLPEKTDERQSMLQMWQAYLQATVKHRITTLQWQYTSSVLIFWIVILIVLTGLVFSGVQFYIALRHAAKTSGSPGGAADPLAHGDKVELEASLKGLKVSSSILGIIILVISLLFFYLYLIYVYPVQEVGRPPEIESILRGK